MPRSFAPRQPSSGIGVSDDAWKRDIERRLDDALFGLRIISSDYTMLGTDTLLEMETSNTTLILAPVTFGKVVYVKNASSGDVNIRGQGSQMILTTSSNTTLTLSTGEAATLYSNASAWRVF